MSALAVASSATDLAIIRVEWPRLCGDCYI